MREHNPNCPQIFSHQYIILIIGGSGSAKTNPLFNPINQQPGLININLLLINKILICY